MDELKESIKDIIMFAVRALRYFRVYKPAKETKSRNICDVRLAAPAAILVRALPA